MTTAIPAGGENERLAKMSMVSLREEAKARGLKGYSKKKKHELIEMLLGKAPVAPVPMTIPQLRESIKARGGKGYSGKTKKELEEMLARLPQ